MNKQRAIAIFDIGKTNKKLFLFDEEYTILSERSVHFPEITDEDGFPCEDLSLLTDWIKRSLSGMFLASDLDIVAVNFSAYGASFVHLDHQGNPVGQLYNYLKPFPDHLRARFYKQYGGEIVFSQLTASPVLGNLNSGLQLYRIKQERPELFQRIDKSLHLPQYFSRLVTGRNYSDITSIGCHTGLWNFQQQHYHEWTYREEIIPLLPELYPSDQVMQVYWEAHPLSVGVGLHDSSSALIPYLSSFSEPFVLISTGTWNISLNPFNHTPLTAHELKQDCLCYLGYRGKAVKASRLFAGFEHEQQAKRLAAHFLMKEEYYQQLGGYKEKILHPETEKNLPADFSARDLSAYPDYETAYYGLIASLIAKQVISTSLILGPDPAQNIFVDGGFGKNKIFMQMLANAFPQNKIFAANVAQASAIGAALAIHGAWNRLPIPADIIELTEYQG